MAKILGIDVGKTTIGYAVSDFLKITAQPQGVVKYQRVNKNNFIIELQKIIVQNKIKKIVYGLPLNMDGTKSATTIYVEETIALAQKKITLPFIAWDERMSSQLATKLLVKGNFKKSLRKKNNDQIAAAIILQSYLDYCQNKAL